VTPEFHSARTHTRRTAPRRGRTPSTLGVWLSHWNVEFGPNWRKITAMDVALGLKARTGQAVLVAVGGTLREPLVVERSVLRLLPEGAIAP